MAAARNQIAQELGRRGLHIDVLVNNAGFGLLGPHAELDTQRQLDMLQVNIMGAQSAADVARVGFIAFERNQTIAVSGYKNRVLANLGKFSPRYVTRKMAQALNR